jgi:hypothetical protein
MDAKYPAFEDGGSKLEQALDKFHRMGNAGRKLESRN